MVWPKITVVTLSFNQAAFLEEALHSVLDQDYPALEYIVVDPGSSDGSRDIISRHESGIDRIIFEPDDGPADGLNRALAYASGDLFAYINSDDAFLPGAFRQAAAAFARQPNCDVVYGNGYFIDAKGNIKRRFLSDRYSAKRSVHGCAVVMQQSTFLRRAAVESVGGFVVDNRTSWDGELLLDIALNGGRFFRAWQDWGLFRIHDSSITGQQSNLEQYRRDCDRQFRKVYGRDPGLSDRILAVLARPYKLVSDPRRTSTLLIDRSPIDSRSGVGAA